MSIFFGKNINNNLTMTNLNGRYLTSFEIILKILMKMASPREKFVEDLINLVELRRLRSSIHERLKKAGKIFQFSEKCRFEISRKYLSLKRLVVGGRLLQEGLKIWQY